MPALLLLLALVVPAPSAPPDWDDCLQHLPVTAQSDLPIVTFPEARKRWTETPSVSADSLRHLLSDLRTAEECFRSVPVAERDMPYRGVVYPLLWSAFQHAGLRQFSRTEAVMSEALSYLDQPLFTPDSLQSTRRAERARLYEHQGYFYYMIGDLSASLRSYLRAYENTPPGAHAERAQYLIDVGLLQRETQDYRSARYYFRRADALFQSTSLTDTTQRARLLSARAYTLLEETLNTTFDREALERAARYARGARARRSPDTEPYHRAAMALSESLGYLEEFEPAYRINDACRRFARENDNTRLHAYCLLKLGVLHVQTRRWERADSALTRSLRLSEALSDLDYQRRALRGLGRLHEMTEEWAAAERYYRNGIRVVEQYRESLTASQWSLTAFAQWRDVHRGLVRTLLAQDRDTAALAALDRSRARHLQDLRTQSRVSEALSVEARARYDSLSRALTQVRTRLAQSARPPDSLRTREARLMAARQQVLQIDSLPARPSIDETAQVLEDTDRTLVSYFLDDPWPVYDRPSRSAAFVLTADSLRVVPLPGVTQSSVQRRVDAISPLFQSREAPSRANAMHFDLRPLHEMYETLYAPVAAHLPAGQSLTVVPDGPLFYFPFSMLVSSMDGGRFAPAQARYVLHERPTSLELATSLVADTTAALDWSTYDPPLAAYGVSTFDTLRTAPSALRSAVPQALTDSTLGLPPLPGVQKELRALSSTVADTRVALNQDASEPAFRRDVERAGVLHVASHAFVNAPSPLQNAILLRTDTTAAPSSDGVLFLHELQGRHSAIPLVVLSGCSTAEGTLRGGEGMEGLQYAFRAMGARATLSTLWPVVDETSVTLMSSFYDYLEDGHPKDRALQRAQLDYLRAHPEQASPFFWAPAVLYGSPRSLPLEAPSPLPMQGWGILGLLGLLVLAGLALWWVQRRTAAA
jgi:CHAT domain-containing protein